MMLTIIIIMMMITMKILALTDDDVSMIHYSACVALKSQQLRPVKVTGCGLEKPACPQRLTIFVFFPRTTEPCPVTLETTLLVIIRGLCIVVELPPAPETTVLAIPPGKRAGRDFLDTVLTPETTLPAMPVRLRMTGARPAATETLGLPKRGDSPRMVVEI